MQARRHFLKTAIGGSAGLIAIPSIFSGSLFAATSPNKRIQIGQIGCGRMGLGDMEALLDESLCRVVAVCDLDSLRAANAKKIVEDFYKKKGESNVVVKVYSDHREMLASSEIDAVVNSTPDHWHGLIGVAAAIAGKHIYGQKPLAYNIEEAIAIRQAVQAKKVIFQTGSQQRSEKPYGAFRSAIDAIQNGRLGKLKTVKIGIGIDKISGKKPASMPVPATFDYERWLGPAPQQEYMEGRCHPQNSVGRPGWITTEDFGLGMITNWGAHHIDIAHLAMGQELGGPLTIDSKASFMKDDVWTVHSKYHVEMLYPNDVQVILDDKYENGLLFEGEEGTIFCTRGAAKVTASDPNSTDDKKSPLRASNPKLLAELGAGAKRMAPSANHYRNWLESIISNSQPSAPVDQAAKTQQACSAAWIGMKLGTKLTWDAKKEAFVGNDAANAMCSRPARKAEYDIQALLKSAGI
jgi:myo-inositol 2-dehydrogenase / D-chiro-inositol 1-dehydrogenase